MKQPDPDRIRRLLSRLRNVASPTPLLALQENEALLWALDEGLLADLAQEERRIVAAFEARRSAYEATLALAAEVFPKLGVRYSLVKALRAHPFANTDVNVMVEPRDYARVLKHLAGEGWSKRPLAARAKEWLAERGKKKLLPPAGQVLAAIHLYPCATWHGLEYLSAAWILAHSAAKEWRGREIVSTDALGDLLLHYGHAAFERYNLTFGELYHHQMARLELGDDGVERARLTAVERGWGRAFELVDRTVRNWWRDPDPPLPRIELSRDDLRRSWRLRSEYLWRCGRPLAALQERVVHAFWLGRARGAYRWWLGLKRGRLRSPKVVE
jgi:hypothetical protein